MAESTYIALLRGINVGGHTITMDILRRHFEDMGFHGVRSYIQTGNVFFRTAETDLQDLRGVIEEHLHQNLGYEVSTCLRSIADLERVVARQPFKDLVPGDDTRLAVSFLAEPAAEMLPIPYRTPDGAYELVDMTPTEMYVVWHLQNGRPGRSYSGLERRVAVPATTRFWHTTQKILTAAKAAST